MSKKELSGRVMVNSRGNETAIEHIKPEHLKRDSVVKKCFNKVEKLKKQMEKTKQQVLKEINKYNDYLCKINGMEPTEINNLTLSSYDNTMQVNLKSSSVIDFDEHLQLAEIKVKECLKRWGKESHPNIVAIINNAFRTDKKGFVNKNEVLSLFQYDIKDKDWKEAMELIKKSIRTVERKQYLMLRSRKNQNADWENFNLNFSSIDIDGQ